MKLPAIGALTGRAISEWIGKTPDSKPPRAVLDRLFLRQMGKDAITGDKIWPGKDKTHADHILPLKDGGENRETNLQLILVATHKQKTADENKQRAKEARIRAKHFGYDTRPKKKIPSRPFGGWVKPAATIDPDT